MPRGVGYHLASIDSHLECGRHNAAQRTLRSIQKCGRIGGQLRFGYGRRSRVEGAMHRYGTIIGRQRHGRRPSKQNAKASIACDVLDRMASIGKSGSVRIK
jgi:hypothetical protein